MPLLSSLGAASSHGWDHSTPVVTGGTLTADATYYYRTFTDHTSWNELTVSGGPVEMDVLVVGHGGDGHVSQNKTVVAQWNYGYHSYTSCYEWNFNDCINQYPNGYVYNCQWSFYCDAWGDCYAVWPRVCQVAYNYYADNSRTYNIYSGGGGAGGVATGKITVAPGIHLITVAAKNGLTLPGNSEPRSTAFGIWTLNGGEFGKRGANGAGLAFESGQSTALGLAITGYSYPDATSQNSMYSYKPNESSAWSGVTTAPMVTAGSYSITNTSGNAGSGDGTEYGYGALSTASYSIEGIRDANILNNDTTVDILYYGGWGGGAGKAGWASGYKSYANNVNDPFGSPASVNGEQGVLRFAPTKLVNGSWSRAGLSWMYASNYIKSSINNGSYTGNVGLFEVDYGIGIQALGLKVAGGGMGNRSARSLGLAYGGGYPGDSASVDPWGLASQIGQPGFELDEWDITPHINGKPNTGGGGGGGTGGSGVVRVRYLRSAVGG